MTAFATYRSVNPLLLMALLAGFFIGGLPSLAGVTFAAANSQPGFSLDLCHPVQSANSAAGVTLTAPDPPPSLHRILFDFGAQVETVTPGLEERSDPPDSPPPK